MGAALLGFRVCKLFFFSFFTHDCQLICELMVLQVWGDCEVKLLTNTVFHSVIMNSCCAHIIRELSNTEK